MTNSRRMTLASVASVALLAASLLAACGRAAFVLPGWAETSVPGLPFLFMRRSMPAATEPAISRCSVVWVTEPCAECWLLANKTTTTLNRRVTSSRLHCSNLA